jgi:hypothetical protein
MIRYPYTRTGATRPAPFVHVTLRTPVIGPPLEITHAPGQIDSAADRTVIPERFVQQLQLVHLDSLEVSGLGGGVTILPTYLVILQVRGAHALTIEVLASDVEPCVLLGRDVLNQIRILLDGPAQFVEIG